MKKTMAILCIVAFVLSIASLGKTYNISIQEKAQQIKTAYKKFEANQEKKNNPSGKKLEELINSDSHNSWVKAAKSKHTNKEQLMSLAKKCSQIETDSDCARKLTEKILNNKNVTKDIVYELSSSKFANVLAEISESSHADEKVLKVIAKSCVKSPKRDYTITTIKNICENKNTTDAVLSELINIDNHEALLTIAKSDCLSKTTLKQLAIKCAEISSCRMHATDIAKAICNHKSANDAALNELTKSKYHDILNVVARSDKAGKTSLKNVAIKCAEMKNNRDAASRIANNICSNANTSDEIINELTKTNYLPILHSIADSESAGKLSLKSVAIRCAEITNNRDQATNIAYDICNNKNSNTEIINELISSKYTEVLGYVIDSQYSTEATLKEIAIKCAKITNSQSNAVTLANDICDSSKATDEVLNELTKSKYNAVLEIISDSNAAGKLTLKSLAIRCADIKNNKEMAQRIANNICSNKNATDEILKELAKSKYSSVKDLIKSK